MAKKVEENYNDMIAEKQSQPTISLELEGELVTYPNAIARMRVLLSELNANSKVAIWRLMYFTFAAKITTQQKYFDQAKIELTAIKNLGNTINDEWMTQAAKEFQYGDVLHTFNLPNGKKRLGYLIQDDSKRVIKAAASSRTANGATLLKVASEVGGVLVKVPTSEFNAFLTYLDRIQPPGCNIIASTLDGDFLSLYAKVYFDPLKGTIADFETRVKNSVKLAIKTLNFRGVLTRDLIEDAISSVDGVIYYELVNLKAKVNGGAYPLSDIIMKYETVAGYILPDPDEATFFKIEVIAQTTA